MKKVLPALALVLALFSSCTKSTQLDPEPKKYDVTFSVADFAQSASTLSTDHPKTTLAIGDTLKNYADNLYYRIYNSAGVMVNSIDQASTLATFGTISDKLPAGTYNVFFAAAKGTLYPSSAQSIFNNAVYSTGSTAWSETFVKVLPITIATTAVTQAVKLDRVVGGLQVTLQDAIPSNAAKISLVYQLESTFLYMNNTNTIYPSNSITKDFPLTTTDIGQKNKTFLMYIGNTVSTSSVIIRAYDSNNGLIVEKTIPNVRCYKNQKTSLTGSLFPSTPNTSLGFTVTVNPTWDTPTSPVIPFTI